jgi:hypothetical protein
MQAGLGTPKGIKVFESDVQEIVERLRRENKRKLAFNLMS